MFGGVDKKDWRARGWTAYFAYNSGVASDREYAFPKPKAGSWQAAAYAAGWEHAKCHAHVHYSAFGRRLSATFGKAVYRGRVLAQAVNAGNDRNGIPRRGWLIYALKSPAFRIWLGFVDEGYRPGAGPRKGWQAVKGKYPRAQQVGPTLRITPKQYRNLLTQTPRRP